MQLSHQMLSEHKTIARGPKLSFPEFEASDPDGWIRKTEKYFELVAVPNKGRVKIAVMHVT